MNYYSFHIGDYAAHTRRLSLLEDLAYRRLLDEYYLQEQPLLGEPDLIARQIGMAEYVDEVDYVLTCFFESTPNGYINKRCDEEIAKYHSKHEQAIRAGKASAEKRLNKRSTSVQLTNNQEPITKNQIDIKPVAKATKGTRWSKDNQISEDWIAYCKEKRPDLDYKDVFESFTDYWISVAGAKGVKLDWDATWRTWVRNQRSKVSVSKTSEDKTWMFSNQGIEAKARELGVSDYGVANHYQLKEKILLVMAKKAMA